MASQFTNPFTNPGGFFSSQEGGFFAPPKREGFGGFLSDPRLSIGMAIAQGQPIGKALLGGAIQAKQIEESMFPDAEERKIVKGADGRQRYVDTGELVFPNVDPTPNKAVYKNAIVNDPNASNFGKTIFVNDQNLDQTITVNGIETPKYLPTETITGSEPKNYFDKKLGKLVSISQSDANANPSRYFEPTKEINQALLIDNDGVLNKNELLKIGTRYQLLDASSGAFKETITLNEYNDRIASDPSYAQKFSIAPLGTGSAEVLTSGLNKNQLENKKLIEKDILTNSALNLQIDDIITNMMENPSIAAAGVGFTASTITKIRSFAENIGLANADTYDNFLNNADKYISTDTNFNWAEKVKQVSLDYNINESLINNTAYALAAAFGQEGRGLSDKDWSNALKILSGGGNATERTAVLYELSQTLKKKTKDKIEKQLFFLTREEPTGQTESLIKYYTKVLNDIDIAIPNIDMNNIITTDTIIGADILNEDSSIEDEMNNIFGVN